MGDEQDAPRGIVTEWRDGKKLVFRSLAEWEASIPTDAVTDHHAQVHSGEDR